MVKITLIFCILVAIIIMCTGCTTQPSKPPSDTSDTSPFTVESSDGYTGEVSYVYSEETNCMCHVLLGYSKGGISCIPCSQLDPGTCEKFKNNQPTGE
jgi:hypothetical protein